MGHQNLRKKIIEVALKMSEEGLVLGTWGNVSCRVPGEPFMIITPSGIEYSKMDPEDLVIADWEGNLVEGRWKPSTESQLHAEIYKNRPDVGAVVHTHSAHATAFAVARKAIPVITEEMAQIIGGPVEVAEYRTCGTAELAAAASSTLGKRSAVLLANHGIVGVGKDVNEAFRACIMVEKAARVAILAQSLGGYVALEQTEVDHIRAKFIAEYGQKQ